MVNILIGCTGSVATIKLPILVKSLLELQPDVHISVITTERAKHFFDVSEIPDPVKVYDDKHEWDSWSNRGDPVLHIDLGKWADLFLIAPLDANTLGKMANGICDNLLTCTARAWDLTKPLLFCPAMNTRMYEHPLTLQQIGLLESWGHQLIPVVSKALMCGEIGDGGMAEVSTIIQYVQPYTLN
ncbi:hypothetical protein RI129_010934 [Pyrocoelia pectoralis]|uniref:Phosphopantothenoylcysteine decarboxylase n=1 Tax=Pyrocoelia pectoralis TaxID=417401 RepID=A0AAN7V4C6_9COLE